MKRDVGTAGRTRTRTPSTVAGRALTGVVMAAAALGACADAAPGDTQSPADTSFGTPDAGPALEPVTPVELLTVDTGVSDDGPFAGDVVQVFCSVLEPTPPGADPVLFVAPEGDTPPRTSWEIFATPEGLSAERSPVIDEEASTVVFRGTGEYLVRCTLEDTGWIDPTPVTVRVYAGEAEDLETVVEPATLKAGDVANVTCSGSDAYGNPVEQDWNVLVAPGGAAPGPAGGLVAAPGQVKGLLMGTYEVACQQKAGGVDTTPALVTVEHGLPYRLVTTLGDGFVEQVIEAGGQTKVSCHAEDKQGNTVPDLPMSVNLPSKVELVGLNLTGTSAGKYTIRCVPSGLSWTAFVLDYAVLEVAPGAPVTLDMELQPDKPFYKPLETVTVLALAEDQFGNIVPDAELTEIAVDPDQDFKATSEKTFLFYEEGLYTLTGALANQPGVSDSVDVAIAGSPPALTVTHPLRGAMLKGFKPSVTVTGIANQPIVAITEVLVNGVPAALQLQEDGAFTFSQIVVPRWGLNILDIEATDEAGEVTTIQQSFYFAEQYLPLEPEPPIVPDAIKVWLSKDFIDDGVHNPTKPDDLATILENVISALDLSTILPSELDMGGDSKLTLSNLQMNPPKLSLTPNWGQLDTDVEIKNFYVKLKIKCVVKILGIDICPDFGGSVSIDKMDLDAALAASAVQGDLDVALQNPKVNLTGLDIDVDGILGWLFDWLIDFFVWIFTGTIEDAFEDQLSGALEGTLEEVLNAFAISQTLDIPPLAEGLDPISLTLDTNVWTLAISPPGMQIGLGARIDSTKGIAQDPLGTIARGTCLKGYPVNWQLPGVGEFEAAVFDDLINAALTAVWYGGTMNLNLDDEALAGLMGGDEGGGGLDLAGLPIDGIGFATTFLLPPILNGCDPDGLLKIQIGDLFVDVDLFSPLFDGGLGELGLYLVAEITASIYVTETDEGPAVGLVLEDLTTLDYHWEYVPEVFEGAEESLEALLEDQLLGAALDGLIGEPLGEFPIPEIDLGTLTPLFPEGSVIVPVLDDLSHSDGHTAIEGYLE